MKLFTRSLTLVLVFVLSHTSFAHDEVDFNKADESLTRLVAALTQSMEPQTLPTSPLDHLSPQTELTPLVKYDPALDTLVVRVGERTVQLKASHTLALLRLASILSSDSHPSMTHTRSWVEWAQERTAALLVKLPKKLGESLLHPIKSLQDAMHFAVDGTLATERLTHRYATTFAAPVVVGLLLAQGIGEALESTIVGPFHTYCTAINTAIMAGFSPLIVIQHAFAHNPAGFSLGKRTLCTASDLYNHYQIRKSFLRNVYASIEAETGALDIESLLQPHGDFFEFENQNIQSIALPNLERDYDGIIDAELPHEERLAIAYLHTRSLRILLEKTESLVSAAVSSGFLNRAENLPTYRLIGYMDFVLTKYTFSLMALANNRSQDQDPDAALNSLRETLQTFVQTSASLSNFLHEAHRKIHAGPMHEHQHEHAGEHREHAHHHSVPIKVYNEIFHDYASTITALNGALAAANYQLDSWRAKHSLSLSMQRGLAESWQQLKQDPEYMRFEKLVGPAAKKIVTPICAAIFG